MLLVRWLRFSVGKEGETWGVSGLDTLDSRPSTASGVSLELSRWQRRLCSTPRI